MQNTLRWAGTVTQTHTELDELENSLFIEENPRDKQVRKQTQKQQKQRKKSNSQALSPLWVNKNPQFIPFVS